VDSIQWTVFSGQGDVEPKPGQDAPRWEHAAMTHNQSAVGGAELSRQINQMGNEGWELVNVSNVLKDGTTEKTIFYFKRPK
jgi:hypothetical protein